MTSQIDKNRISQLESNTAETAMFVNAHTERIVEMAAEIHELNLVNQKLAQDLTTALLRIERLERLTRNKPIKGG